MPTLLLVPPPRILKNGRHNLLPLVRIGLTVIPKLVGAHASPAPPPPPAALYLFARTYLWFLLQGQSPLWATKYETCHLT